jgi:hypothetical protein
MSISLAYVMRSNFMLYTHVLLHIVLEKIDEIRFELYVALD